MKPENATPGNFKHNGQIIYTSPDGHFSIAKGEWTEDGMNRFAMRWNGNPNDPADKGYPSVFSNPMWFQLPYDISGLITALIEHSGPMQVK